MKRIRKRFAGFLALVLACSVLSPGNLVLAEEPEAPETCQITVKESEHGTILLNKEAVSVLEIVPGELVEVTGEPEEGYQLAGVAAECSNGEIVAMEQSDVGYIFRMPAQNVTVSASFEPVVEQNKNVPTVGTAEAPLEQETEELKAAETEASKAKLTNVETGQSVEVAGNQQEETVNLYRYLTFYDTASGDVNATVGFHVLDLTGVIRGEYIEAVVNDHLEWLNLEETDGYPRVILNYAMNQGKQTDITEECMYDAQTGVIRIPASYRGEFLTVKSVLCDYSMAYQMLVPEEYRVNKNLPMPMLTFEDGPTDETDWAVYGVVDGSCNDTLANGDISGYEVGDRIPVISALTQTVARNTSDMEGTLDLYDELGMSAYRTGFGWTGFAVSLDCGQGNPFTNIGSPGTGSTVRTFPGVGAVALNSRNWMYARCVTDDADNFSGNGRFTGGHIKVIGKAADGTLTCWLYLERTGPSGQAAQNIGMVFKVHPSNGSLEIQKSSAIPEITNGNPCYSLEGAEYTVYQSGTSTAVGKITTNASGYGKLDNLPAGTYDIVETKAPSGYLLDTTRHTVTVNGSATVTYSCADVPGNDPVTILILKRDAETGQARPQVRLAGAEYTVKYYPVNASTDPAANGEEPMYTWILQTDETGAALLEEAHKVGGDAFVTNPDSGLAVLPVGTLTIQETKAPAGYLINDTVYVANTVIREGTSVVTTNLPNTEETPASEQVIRGDLEFTKVDADDESPMAGIPFSITSETTGEIHVILTDKNGHASTSAEWNPHTQFTNRGETAEDGVWFGGGEPDNALGALPYDTYDIEELPCEANAGKDLLSFSVTVSRNNHTISLGRLSNFTIGIRTEARDEKTGTKTVAAEDDASIIDTFYYENLTVRRTYTLRGVLMDAETGEELQVEGSPVTAETSFAPTTRNGQVELRFSLDASSLEGRTIVVYIELYWKEIKLAEHKDLADEAETVRVPTVGTTALDRDTDSHVGSISQRAVLVDTVFYTGLTAGKEYTLSGTLMVQTTGEPLLSEGKPVTAEKTFVPEKPDGTVELSFIFDSRAVAGDTIVAFEEVSYQGIPVAAHTDLEDQEQSVAYPDLQTEAICKETGNQQVAVGEKSQILDQVSLKNLLPGESYTLRGKLVDVETGKILTVGEEEAVAEHSFTAERAEEIQEMMFSLDTTAIRGKTLVVYEYLLYQDVIVASHADRFDENQTVYVPELQTTALDQETNSHTGAVKDQAVITDVVNYKNLIPGREYTVSGKLMVKETGEALLQEGEPVTAETTFTPEEPAGSVTLTYSVDSSLLSGQTVVVFEDLIQDGITLLSHADLEDEEQSIYYPIIRTEARVSGSHTAVPAGNTELVDTVSYKNLIAGCDYTIQGTLMNMDTGEALLVHGKEVTASRTFTAEEPDGTVEVSFTFDASGLAGKTVVVYERMYHNNVFVAGHEELEDEAQAVYFEVPPQKPDDHPQTGDPFEISGILTGIALAISGSCFFMNQRRKLRK